MRHDIRQSGRRAIRAVLRIRPGGLVVRPPPLLRRIGADATNLTVVAEGGQLVVARRPSCQEARVARLRLRLAARLGKRQPLVREIESGTRMHDSSA